MPFLPPNQQRQSTEGNCTFAELKHSTQMHQQVESCYNLLTQFMSLGFKIMLMMTVVLVMLNIT